MPGELGNIIAGRVANLFNLRGPELRRRRRLRVGDGGDERRRSRAWSRATTTPCSPAASTATWARRRSSSSARSARCRPPARGPTPTAPTASSWARARRSSCSSAWPTPSATATAIYAVLRGIAGASDGKGKGITAPNPVGQRLAVERAWRNAGLPPDDGEPGRGPRHLDAGRRRRRGGEPQRRVRPPPACAPQSVPLGSVKSNIGHLKGAAGAAGLLKAVLALHHKQLPPSLNFERPNPAIDFAHSPFAVNTRAARLARAAVRRAPRRRQRLRLRRHELPRRARGVHARAPDDNGRSRVVPIDPRARRRPRGTCRTGPAHVRPSTRRHRARPARNWTGRSACAARWSSARATRGRAARPPRSASQASRRCRPRTAPGTAAGGRSRCAHRSAWRSTTATPPSWPTRPARR